MSMQQTLLRVQQKMVETGEGERLKETLRQQLYDSGWQDDLRASAKEYVRGKAPEDVKADQLVAYLLEKGQATVPASIKAEMLANINEFIKLQVF